MEILVIFGRHLKELRKERKLRQKDMGDLLEMTLRNYQRLEKGEINPSALTLCILADYFEVSTDYLLGRTEER